MPRGRGFIVLSLTTLARPSSSTARPFPCQALPLVTCRPRRRSHARRAWLHCSKPDHSRTSLQFNCPRLSLSGSTSCHMPTTQKVLRPEGVVSLF